MRTPALRVLAVAALAAAGLTCADDPISGVRGVRGASFALAPAFTQAPPGGPQIVVARIRGVLRGGTDSVIAESSVQGDSAVLVFERVQVRGDSTIFTLGVSAFDPSNVVVFQSVNQVSVKPGANAPAEPVLQYTAPDATVDSIDVPGTIVELDWAGAAPGNTSCRNRVPDAEAKTQEQLTVQGFAAGSAVPNVRVGWTSRDTSVATVDANGLVRARCSNRSTYIVARTFLNEADSIAVNVSAPPFSLLMDPDSVSLARGDTVRLMAVVVDENGNVNPAASVSWHSSDPARATVNSTGLVQAITNGRVQITAASEGRVTIGIVQVVRPPAARVIVTPGLDTAAVGQVRAFFARAADASGRIIGDARGFEWFSRDPEIASVDPATGLVKAHGVGTTFIFAKLDGVKDSIEFVVQTTRPPGAISARIVDAVTDAPLAGALVNGPAGQTAQSGGDGRFTLEGLQPGDNVTVTLDGYVGITLYDAPIYPNTTLRLPDAPMVPGGTGPGHMSGFARHAISGQGVSGIAVHAYRGVNAAPSPTNPSATSVASTQTVSDGSYTFTNLDAGIYTLLFKGVGYSEVVSVGIVIGGGQTTSQDAVLLPPASTSSGLAIVLTWGDANDPAVPDDLDMHLTGPGVTDTTQRFHVYQASRSFVFESDTIAALDLDDTSGPGPEIIGLRASAAPGTYRLYVHDFSNRATGTSQALSDSSFARVDVYQNNRVIGTFFPPAGAQGTLWEVFTYDGARLTPVNVISFPADVTVLPMIVGPLAESEVDLARVSATLSAPKK